MSEYDFYISSRGYLNIPEINKKYLVSYAESEISDMPEALETSVRIAGKDGDIVLGTTYEPRNFSLVCYTEDNLSPIEKEQEISALVSFLNSIKNEEKKLAFLNSEKMYSVKYHKQLTVLKMPKCVCFTIPLKSSDAYGMELNKKVINGAGSENSNTIEETGCVITINGPCQTPTIALNDYQMKYEHTVLSGNKLIIDTGNSTIIHITSEGVVTNAAIYYNHEYPMIKNGINEIKVLSGVDDPSQVVTEWYDLKL